MNEENIEVEVTIDVDEQGYKTFCNAMETSLVDVYDQWNVFFDTVDHSLIKSSKRCRVRSIDSMKNGSKYTICSKMSKSDSIEGSIARRREVEENISKEQFDQIIQHPDNYYKLSPLEIQNELSEFENIPFCFLVDFRSIRRIYKLDELLIESDECILPNDKKFYQLEVESKNPEAAKASLEKKLQELNIKYKGAEHGKFTMLISVPPNERFSKKLRAQIEQNIKT